MPIDEQHRDLIAPDAIVSNETDAPHAELISKAATELAQHLLRPGGLAFSAVATQLADLARQMTDAEVACCRVFDHAEVLDLCSSVSVSLDGGVRGTVPRLKHRSDYRIPLDVVGGGRRDQTLDVREPNFYSIDNLEYFDWIGSEAFIPLCVSDGVPKAVLELAHHDPDHFGSRRISAILKGVGFFDAFYRLAELTEDRLEKGVILEKVARVLPMIASAPSRKAFQHAICALLTCHEGLGFDRALLFWMDNRAFPAECQMAIGGTGDKWITKDDRLTCEVRGFRLRDYVANALAHPIPEAVDDPLYDAACKEPLFVREDDFAELGAIVADPSRSDAVTRLNSSHPWVAQIKRERPDIFCAQTDEYFVFPLKPFGGQSDDLPIGFVLADLAYRPQTHIPGRGFPDLQMTAFILNLIAGMWRFREETDSLFYMLAAIPVLRHSAPDLSLALERLELAQKSSTSSENIQASLDSLWRISEEFGKAKDIVEGMTTSRMSRIVSNLDSFLRRSCESATARHPILKCSVDHSPSDTSVRIQPDTLESILQCLLDNAAAHARTSDSSQVTVRIRVDTVRVPEPAGSKSHRVLIVLENDGAAIPREIAPFLFVDRVSTSTRHGQGSGLSTARLQAKAFGGDVILLSLDPVQFGIVLDIPLDGKLTHDAE
ncbi:MAG: sensor histidine kinase [Planctomycetales bacterium]|nr:sensor histidine kinase [Planctomycetales bacterium]